MIPMRNHRSATKVLTASIAMLAAAGANAFEPEPVGRVETLPDRYPAHWAMLHDFSFFHMLEGKIVLVDPLEDTLSRQYKAAIPAGFIAAFQHGASRNEHYVIESFHDRGGRGGKRTDMVTVYDPSSLEVTAEIEIPAKRITGMPKTIMTGLIGDERFLGVYNFTPGQSVSIVDLAERSFVGEIPIAGCAFLLPNGARSFTSICANGSLLTVHLNEDGTLAGTDRSPVAFDAEQDPIFESVGIAGGVAYFPTFAGQMLPVDIGADRIEVGEPWWLTGEDERGWRPGGMTVIVADSEGLGYVLMNPDGAEGTHKDGGAEVWVFDLAAGTRVGRFELANWGLSLGTTGSGDDRLLLVTNADMTVDVYRVPDGQHIRTLDVGAGTPFLVYGAR